MELEKDDETQPHSNFFNAFPAPNLSQPIQPPQQNQNQQFHPNMPNIQIQEQNNQDNQLHSLSQLNPNQNPNSSNELNQNKINNNNYNNINNNNKNSNLTSEVNKTKLENSFSFWYRISDDIVQYQAPKQALDKKIYETQVKKIHEFDTVEEFWGIFQHLRKPDSCKPGIEFMMFKEPIKPMWEDEGNKNGGKISIKLRKEYTTIIWEEMIFALIGGILPKEMKDEINGIVVTSRKEFNTLQIWFKTFDEKINNDLVQCIRDLLVIPDEVNLEVKQFNKNKNEKKTGGYYNKSYNNYYDDGYDGYEDYKEEKNQYKKNKHHYNKNK
jgi:translation initiation factor 4E